MKAAVGSLTSALSINVNYCKINLNLGRLPSSRNVLIPNQFRIMSSIADSEKTMNGKGKRGALIVFEGCDKAGKSTQCKLLADALNKNGHTCRLMNFPDRTTEIGKMIDQYLKCNKSLSDEAIHLLFSANRWELAPSIRDSLERGETVIVDRYAFSGVAFSAAKGTLDLQWCKGPDVGLPQPDQVFYLNVSEDTASTRGDYGQERYEKKEFQEKVKQIYLEIQDPSYWKIIDASRSIQEVHDELYELSHSVISSCGHNSVLPLWRTLPSTPHKQALCTHTSV